MYAYNGPAWAAAIEEADRVDQIKLVSFDATTDIIDGLKEGVIDVTVSQREFDMGYKSVQLIYLISTKGQDAAFGEMGVMNGVIDTGVDVISQIVLKLYEAELDAKGIPHEWSTGGWEPTRTSLDQWIVLGKSCQLPTIARKAPDHAKADSRFVRIKLKNSIRRRKEVPINNCHRSLDKPIPQNIFIRL